MLKWKRTSSATRGLISMSFVAEIKQELQLLKPPFLPSAKTCKVRLWFILLLSFGFVWAGHGELENSIWGGGIFWSERSFLIEEMACGRASVCYPPPGPPITAAAIPQIPTHSSSSGDWHIV